MCFLIVIHRPKPFTNVYPPHILQALVSLLEQGSKFSWRHKSL